MSRSPFFYLERYSKTRAQWEEISPHIYDKERKTLIPADLWPYNGTHDLFDLLEGDSIEHFKEMHGIQTVTSMNEFKHLSAEVQKELLDILQERYEYICSYGAEQDKKYVDEHSEPSIDDLPIIRYITYADLLIYCLQNDSTFEINPVQALADRVKMFMDINDPWRMWQDDYSNIRVVYWIL